MERNHTVTSTNILHCVIEMSIHSAQQRNHLPHLHTITEKYTASYSITKYNIASYNVPCKTTNNDETMHSIAYYSIR